MKKLILISSVLLSTQILAGQLEPVYNVLVKKYNRDKVTINKQEVWHAQ